MMRFVVKALLSDVQGTATDFHSTVCEAAQRISAGRHPGVDWPDVVRRWRADYFAALDAAQHRHPRLGFGALGVSRCTGPGPGRVRHRGSFGCRTRRADSGLAAPGAVAGCRARTESAEDRVHVGHPVERRRFRGGQYLQARAGLPWDAIFAAEMAGVFKPDPAIYRMAATYLGLEPAEIMMVASHKYDIRAAGSLGFRTAFVARPLEFGIDGEADVAYSDEFDINYTLGVCTR